MEYEKTLNIEVIVDELSFQNRKILHVSTLVAQVMASRSQKQLELKTRKAGINDVVDSLKMYKNSRNYFRVGGRALDVFYVI